MATDTCVNVDFSSGDNVMLYRRRPNVLGLHILAYLCHDRRDDRQAEHACDEPHIRPHLPQTLSYVPAGTLEWLDNVYITLSNGEPNRRQNKTMPQRTARSTDVPRSLSMEQFVAIEQAE